jgi:hypothetical protein
MLALLVVGCSRGPEYAEVEGVVTFQGKPLEEVEVIFYPNPEAGTEGPRASCYTDDKGHFRLRSEQSGRGGVVVGKHKVCLQDTTSVPPPPPVDLKPGEKPPEYRKGPPRVPQKYWSVGTTPYRDVEVKPGNQTINFDLKPGPR